MGLASGAAAFVMAAVISMGTAQGGMIRHNLVDDIESSYHEVISWGIVVEKSEKRPDRLDGQRYYVKIRSYPEGWNKANDSYFVVSKDVYCEVSGLCIGDYVKYTYLGSPLTLTGKNLVYKKLYHFTYLPTCEEEYLEMTKDKPPWV